MIIPYQVDVPMSRWPIANWLIIGLTCIVSLSVLFSDEPGAAVRPLILQGWSLEGMVAYILVHGGLLHLAGNMVFLWTFGNAVCAKVGNLAFPFVYVALGICAAAAHLIFSGRPAIGASGAINGVVGMFLVWYPLNDVSCALFIAYRAKSFTVSSYWMILLWFVFDILGAAFGTGGTAYWAHIGGFACGFALGWVLLALKWVEMTPTERSLRDIVLGNR